MKKLPERGEYVIAKVKEVSPNSAIVILEEYNSILGFVHISEVANCWIKDIKKFIRPNQIKVGKILSTDPSRSYINLSFKQVSVNISRDKEKEYRGEQKANNLLKMLAKKTKSAKTPDELKKSILNKFSTLREAFDFLAKDGVEKFSKLTKINNDFANDLYALVQKSLTKRQVEINANINIMIYENDGLNKLKKILNIAEKNVEIKYISAPKYSLKIKGKDYIECETKYRQISKHIMSFADANKNIINIERIKA